MKRLVLEFNYERFWKLFFGPNSERVEVVEALRSFKCDMDGFALIVRIVLKDRNMTVRDLTQHGVVTKVETLYEEKDGSLVVYMQGDYSSSIKFGGRAGRRSQVFSEGPPEFLGPDKMKVVLVGPNEEIRQYLQDVDDSGLPHKILGLTSLKPQGASQMSKLSPRQRQALLSAYGQATMISLGELPLRISQAI